jgi:chemotaxis protein CheY-P-specific phosphatase CheC
MMAESLLAKYKHAFKISKFESLSRDQQIVFAESMIEKVFTRIKTPEQLGMVRLHFYIKLSVAEASKKITQLIGKDLDFNIANAKTMTASSIMEFVEMLDKEVFVVKAELSNFVEGTIYVLLFKEGASFIGDLMLSGNSQDEMASAEFNTMKISALQEFINMLLSSYADAIANIMQGKLYFSIQPLDPLKRYMFVNDTKQTVFLLGERNLENIYISDIILQAGYKHSINGIVLLILKKSPDAMKKFLADKQLSKLEFDLGEEAAPVSAPPAAQIEEKETPKVAKNIKLELALFMDDYFSGHDGNEIIEFLMQDMGIADFNTLDAGTKQEFANRLLETAFKGLSIYRQGIIKSALYDVLGINTMVGGEKIEVRRHEEIKEEKKSKEKDSNIFNLIKKDDENKPQ